MEEILKDEGGYKRRKSMQNLKDKFKSGASFIILLLVILVALGVGGFFLWTKVLSHGP
jgi:hypothetical protein